jgi:hypothetical protein
MFLGVLADCQLFAPSVFVIVGLMVHRLRGSVTVGDVIDLVQPVLVFLKDMGHGSHVYVGFVIKKGLALGCPKWSKFGFVTDQIDRYGYLQTIGSGKQFKRTVGWLVRNHGRVP